MSKSSLAETLDPASDAAPEEVAPKQAALIASLVAERACDRAAVDSLIDRAFGPGRFVKTAERLREHNAPLLDLSFCKWEGGRLTGCVRLWPILIGAAPAVFLGPFAVDADQRSHGLGAALIRRACDAATAANAGVILLVGDLPYFAKFGFETVPAGRLIMPGPVNPARLLWRELAPDAAAGLSGAVTQA